MLYISVCRRERVSAVEACSSCIMASFNMDFRMSLARGRPFMIPITRNIKDVDTWHRSPLADEQDGPVASMAAVRRDLVRQYCFQLVFRVPL